ncbi:ATP-dependent helicase [Verminephrobacter aporrectodeae subsp. tuberculatae]|uniref:UvrD-helicase domain-containing protein n=1 Tax=Verminephrobacter aporrectodeae TaxID=1110389 RepID=UPI002242F766|nr:ATP-dependent helicase [Verminephrobacter aporrectodeae]MCW8166413.1 ATP-dependent helicase [Verminephrobacter aporrectodeae subsp. tuberculatae]MCW8168519.1 ATP-dependent helicase [Verminephrobacter aporrectodeae subsp. tuberculatae]
MIKPESWQPSDGIKLEPNALLAAREIDRSLAVTAGPGAGKTELLAQHADFLLHSGACRYPQRILAISFKVDASRNLKDRVRQRCGFDLASRLDSHTFHAFAKRLIDHFRLILTGKDALDADYTIGKPGVPRRQIEFDNMVPLAVQILKSSDIARNAVRQTYSHVFLDEFQDCTAEQYRLIREAFFGTAVQLTAVGDTKQRIMGWAGALEGVFQTFAADFDARPLNLYQNFRSQPRLRRMQNAMIKVMDPAAAVPNAELAGSGGSVEVLKFEDSQQEAEELTDMIQGWIDDEGVAASEIAVLVSRQLEFYADRLMAGLSERGIPFRNEQSLQDLSAEPAARLIVDFLIVVADDCKPDAYGRLMDVLLVTGIDEDTAYEQRARWHRFIDSARAQVRQGGQSATLAVLQKFAGKFLELLGREALAALSADYEHGARLEEVVAQTYAHIAKLLGPEGDILKVLGRFSEDNAVRIMTIHKSKGLEFDSVVVLGVEKQTFWGKADEERSAFFVAISRAKRRLCLTVADRRERPEGFNQRWDERRDPHQEFLKYRTA